MANVRLKGPTGDREPDAVRMYARMTDVRWSGVDENDIETTEIDLRDRLLFAAGSLAADFGEELSVDLAEALVFSSAEGPMVSASVTEFVPILAERRARQAFRSDASAARSAVPVPRPAVPEPRPAVPTPRPAVPAPRPSVPSSRPGLPNFDGPPAGPAAAPPVTAHRPAPLVTAPPPAVPVTAPPPSPPVTAPRQGVVPLLAVPEGDMTKLRDEVERARLRVADWTADLGRRAVDLR